MRFVLIGNSIEITGGEKEVQNFVENDLGADEAESSELFGDGTVSIFVTPSPNVLTVLKEKGIRLEWDDSEFKTADSIQQSAKKIGIVLHE